MKNIQKEYYRLENNKNLYMKNYQKRIKKLQNQCRHKTKQWEGDSSPIGGFDCGYHCLDCGKLL